MTLPTAATTPAEPEQAAPKERLRGDFRSQPLARIAWNGAERHQRGKLGKSVLDAEDGEGCHRSARHPRRLSTISGVATTHHRGGDACSRPIAGGGQGHPCLSGAKTVGNALRTLPANVASGTLMPSVSVVRHGAYPHTPRFLASRYPMTSSGVIDR